MQAVVFTGEMRGCTMPVCVYTASHMLTARTAYWLAVRPLTALLQSAQPHIGQVHKRCHFRQLKPPGCPQQHIRGQLALVPPRSHRLLHPVKLFSWHRSSNTLRLPKPPTCMVLLLANLACSSQRCPGTPAGPLHHLLLVW